MQREPRLYNTPKYFNRAGIPVYDIKTIEVPAVFWAGFDNWLPTTVRVKFTKK